eukprot:scaffold951_cov431-Prasinococcus_capsulatus_cf.AAC.3
MNVMSDCVWGLSFASTVVGAILKDDVFTYPDMTQYTPTNVFTKRSDLGKALPSGKSELRHVSNTPGVAWPA